MTIVTTEGRAKRVALMSGGELVSSAVLQDGNHLATSLDVTAAEDDNDFLAAVPTDTLPPLPDAGAWLDEGDLYASGGQAVLVRQSHVRTEHDVADLVPTLFLVHRDNIDGIEWVAGESVTIGTVRTYDGASYRCIQAHVTQSDWAPPTVPALWEVYVEPSDEWQAGVTYAIGDVVTYDGTDYECIQAHTSQAGWEPPNVPALWSAV